ncbi:MAG: Na+/H+ antiporter subunit E, partial [Candidatus Omnitrophica bacterium]|nr:Na+/H+ antiporter subunit E [Candidatus Omnitrophota bacterium]
MKRKAVLFLVAFVVWCLLNWPPDWQHLLAGVFVAAFCAFMTGDLFVTRPHMLKHPLRYWHFLFSYLPRFFWECLKANVDVAWRVAHPRLPINPGIVKIKTSLKTDTALTFLA